MTALSDEQLREIYNEACKPRQTVMAAIRAGLRAVADAAIAADSGAKPEPVAVPEGIDEALRALAKVHGWNFVWSRAKALADGTQSCHKCHSDSLTHSSRCIHFDADAERAAMRAAYPEHYAAAPATNNGGAA